MSKLMIIDMETGEYFGEVGETYIIRKRAEVKRKELEEKEQVHIRGRFIKLRIDNILRGGFFENMTIEENRMFFYLIGIMRMGINAVVGKGKKKVRIEDIASKLGVSRSGAYRAINRLKDRCLIKVERGKIYINPVVASNGKFVDKYTLGLFYEENGRKLGGDGRL